SRRRHTMFSRDWSSDVCSSDLGITITDEQPDIVVQGIDRSFTYEKAIKAVQAIRDGAISIMTNPDLLLPANGGFIPGAGSIGARSEERRVGRVSRLLEGGCSST